MSKIKVSKAMDEALGRMVRARSDSGWATALISPRKGTEGDDRVRVHPTVARGLINAGLAMKGWDKGTLIPTQAGIDRLYRGVVMTYVIEPMPYGDFHVRLFRGEWWLGGVPGRVFRLHPETLGYWVDDPRVLGVLTDELKEMGLLPF